MHWPCTDVGDRPAPRGATWTATNRSGLPSIVSDAAAQVVGHVVELSGHRPEAVDGGAERRPVVELPKGHRDQIAGATLRSEGRLSGGRRRPMGVRVSQEGLLGCQPLVLVSVGEADPLDLVELEAQEVDLPLPCPSVAPEHAEGDVGLPDGGSARLEVAQVDTGEPVEGATLARGGQESDVSVLPVEVDEPGRQLGQLARP